MSVTGSDTDGQLLGRWMTIQDAARHLSVSERTIFRRVERGQLGKRSHQDGHVEVWMSLPDGADVDRQCPDVDSDTDRQDRALLLVDRFGDVLTRQLGPLVAVLSESQARAAELARENGRLQERVDTLERELTTVRQASDTDRQTRQDAHSATQEPNPGAIAPDPPSEPSEPPSEPVPAPTPAPMPPEPNGRGLWPRVVAWLTVTRG